MTKKKPQEPQQPEPPQMPPLGKAYVRGRAVTISPPRGVEGPPFLIVQIEISCTTCGNQEFMVAGHHLRPLVDLFQQFIDGDPELTKEGEVEVVATRSWSQVVDPERN